MTAPIYSFPEPEKKTAWTDKDDALSRAEHVAHGAMFRDTERDAAIKRTKLIKEKMSPPGALRLPEKLEAARLKHGIPDGFFRVRALFDRIFVFPLDPFDADEKIPGSVLYRPQITKQKDMQEGFRGVLLSAGLSAADKLMSHGVELGDIVMTNKNVPFARRVELLEGEPMFTLVMREADLAGDETQEADIRDGRVRVVDVGGEGSYCHQIARSDGNGGWDVSKKQSVYIADVW